MPEVLLSPQEFDEITKAEPKFFCPDLAGIKKGSRFFLWVKVGGSMHLSNVTCSSDPYPKGKAANYVDVIGWGISEAVNVKKLLKLKQPGAAMKPGHGIVDR